MSGDSAPAYVPVPLSILRAESVAGFAIFVRSRQGYSLFRESTAELDGDALASLKKAGVTTVYLVAADQAFLDTYYLEHLEQTLADPEVPMETKALALTASSSAVAREIMEKPTRVQINQARPVMEAVVDQVVSLPSILYKLIIGTGSSYSLPSHMVNSAVYAMALCEPLGISDPQEMKALALGGFLLDLGKTQLPENILHKAGQLDASEWVLMRQHPLLGYNLLIGINELPDQVRDAARGHHERMDGAGYPDGLSGSEIPLAARLAAVVDVFNALTTSTPYRKRMSSFEALTVMRDRMTGQFDPDVLRALIKALAQQAAAS